MNAIFTLALFRFRLLIRQKLGWGVVGGASLFFPLSLFLALSSYVRPDKIYYDLCTGFSFILMMLLSSYIGSHLYNEEQSRRTLSYVLTLGFTRRDWLFANYLGLGGAIVAALGLWSLIAAVSSLIVVHIWPPLLFFQAQLFLAFETLVVLSVSLLFSFFMRPLLSTLATISLVILLHSRSQLETLILEASFDGLPRVFYKGILFTLNFLPPLEWWDIRMFVAFAAPYSLMVTAMMTLLTIGWIFAGLFLSTLKMEMMDL